MEWRTIELSRGYKAIVDEEFFDTLNQHKWFAKIKRSGVVYAVRNPARGSPSIRRLIYMHRVVLGAKDGEIIDHKNRDGLDNRIENLRLASASQNNANKTKGLRETTSRYKGVCWHKKDKRWRAAISIEGRTKPLGGYISEDDAASAYNQAAAHAYGEFAVLNRISQQEAH